MYLFFFLCLCVIDCGLFFEIEQSRASGITSDHTDILVQVSWSHLVWEIILFHHRVANTHFMVSLPAAPWIGNFITK